MSAEDAGTKRKAEEAAENEAPAKEARAESKEEEADAPDDKRQRIKDHVMFRPVDATLSVIPASGGRILMHLTDHGMNHLIAAARADVGIKAGRYFYEVRILESWSNDDTRSPKGGRSGGVSKQHIRIGFSTVGSSLFLGESEDGICFDVDGSLVVNKNKAPVSQRFTKDQTLGVMLNLKSTGDGTISLFRDGIRASEPQSLPETLRGKALFPHVAYRGAALQVNWGPSPLVDLPFKCRMVQDAASADTEPNRKNVPKNGKYEVVFPVALPNEGGFEWLDNFVGRNPQYVEVSDRMIMDWALQSGVQPRGPRQPGGNHSTDKPDMNFGIPALDEFDARQFIQTVAPLVPRHYIVMDMRSNLVQAERKELAGRFLPSSFKRIAKIMIGEPPADIKDKTHAVLLEAKQKQLDAEWEVQQAEREKQRVIARRQRELAKLRKAAEKAKKEAEEKEKQKQEECEAKEGAKPEDKKEEEKKVEAAEEDDEPMEPEPEKPKAELTEEEKMQYFLPKQVQDMTTNAISSALGLFSLPQKSDGFEIVDYEWGQESSVQPYLQKWLDERKLSMRIDDLDPSEWFMTRSNEWTKVFGEWQQQQQTVRSDPAWKARQAEKEAKQAEKEAKDQEARDKGQEPEPDPKEDEVDIFKVESVTDTGKGEPLFLHFSYEDWELMRLRFELHLLVRAFAKDAVGRPGMAEQHVVFYYGKYYRKQLNSRLYNQADLKQLVLMVKDTASIDTDTTIFKSNISNDAESFELFVKLTEENRRERQRRIDAGDETARLDFSALQQAQQQAIMMQQQAAQQAQQMAAYGGQVRPRQTLGQPQMQQQQPQQGAWGQPPAWGGQWPAGMQAAMQQGQWTPAAAAAAAQKGAPQRWW